jgi:hypothetical protein
MDTGRAVWKRGQAESLCRREGMGACLVLERRTLPQEALVRDMALGLHAGTEGRQHSAAAAAPMAGPTVYTRDDLWKAGLRNDSATDAAVTELCGGTVVAGLSTQLMGLLGCSTVRGVARAVPHRGHQQQWTRLASLTAAARAPRLVAKGDAALQHAAGAGAPPLLPDLSLKGASAHKKPSWCAHRSARAACWW